MDKKLLLITGIFLSWSALGVDPWAVAALNSTSQLGFGT